VNHGNREKAKIETEKVRDTENAKIETGKVRDRLETDSAKKWKQRETVKGETRKVEKQRHSEIGE